MTNKELANQIFCEHCLNRGWDKCKETCKDYKVGVLKLQEMAEWKDKNNKERELLFLLLEAINYSFLQTDGTYDNKLTYPVIDKVKYIYSQLYPKYEEEENQVNREGNINEEELDEMAKEYARYNLAIFKLENGVEMTNFSSSLCAFKAGYRKAKMEEQ